MSIDSVLIVAGIVAFLIFHYFSRSRDNPEEQIWKLISRNHICQNAGIGEKDIKLSVTSYYEVDASKGPLPSQKQYNFQVSCAMPQSGSKRKQWVVVGKGYSVNMTSDAELIENTIVEDIQRARSNIDTRAKNKN